MLIFLQGNTEPFFFTTGKKHVLTVKSQLKVGDKVDLIVNDFQNNIWGLTVNNKEIISITSTKNTKQIIATYQMYTGLLLFALAFLWEQITMKKRVKNESYLLAR